jgi:3-oxoadipate enol-lactonase
MLTLSMNNTHKLAYEVYGPPDNFPTLLFLHGALMTHSTWVRQVQAFSARHHVLTCDLRGHGESSAPQHIFSVPTCVEDVLTLLDALQIQQVVCCGHSLGGMVAQELALRYPDRVLALILAETSYGTSSTPVEKFLTTITRWMLRTLSVQQIIDLSIKQYGQFNPETRAYLQQTLRTYKDRKSLYLAIMLAALQYSSQARLQQITCPTLVLVGEENKQTHRQAHNMVRLLPNAMQQTVSRAGHMLHMDNPTQFNDFVHAFLEKHVAGVSTNSVETQ